MFETSLIRCLICFVITLAGRGISVFLGRSNFVISEILDIYVSVRQGLAQGDRVKISLDKIDWEINGEIKTEDFPLDGYELMVF